MALSVPINIVWDDRLLPGKTKQMPGTVLSDYRELVVTLWSAYNKAVFGKNQEYGRHSKTQLFPTSSHFMLWHSVLWCHSTKWLGPGNSCVYYACQTLEIYQILPYSVDFKASGKPWNWLRLYLVNVVYWIWIWKNDRKAVKPLVLRTGIYIFFF